jgi:hypothetical protein
VLQPGPVQQQKLRQAQLPWRKPEPFFSSDFPFYIALPMQRAKEPKVAESNCRQQSHC